MSKYLFVLILLTVTNITFCSYGQISMAIPSTPSYNPPTPLFNPPNNYSTQNNNRDAIRQFENDQRNHALMQQRQNAELREAYREMGIRDGSDNAKEIHINYTHKLNKAYGKKHFDKAYQEISSMLDKKTPYNLKRAVFLTEYAYDTTLNYATFERQIARLVNVLQLSMKKDKISPKDNMGKIMTLFKFMADTISVRSPTEKTITTYPKTYDFEDFYGREDYHKMFVSKLIRTGKGQCHSLPLLFLILCQEINAKAYLSQAPEHYYIKFKDKTGVLQNIELTNQMFTTDQFIMQSGYVKAAAIKSKIYMDTLSMERIIVNSLGDLANSYIAKYGCDDFSLKCADKMLVFYPNSINAYMHAADYYVTLGLGIEKQYQAQGFTDRRQYMTQDDKLRQIAITAMSLHKKIDELGFAEMPPDMYSNWLNSLKNESTRQQSIDKRNILNTMIEY